MRKEFNPKNHKKELLEILKALCKKESFDYKDLRKLLSKNLKSTTEFFSKDELISGYKYFVKNKLLTENKSLIEMIQMKPTRTMSGVTTVTVLTKPYPCPGRCIYCPDDIRMPKSYLSNEPGAQRAEKNNFDPYLQTYNRLVAINNIGHSTAKVELIILGGTWSAYPKDYQLWFINECFKAMNDFNSSKNPKEINPDSYVSIEKEINWDELFNNQRMNEFAKARCIGLVVETRPDFIDEDEVIRIRKFGATKVQIGIQSLNDGILNLNGRGHSVKQTIEAIKLLRLAGFKIHAHWMANLYGSTVQEDIKDYLRLWEKGVQPDELKIYPTSIIEGTILYKLFLKGKYKPYSFEELLKVLEEAMKNTPKYCRLTRVIRDIPSNDIVEGNKFTNFRQIVEEKLINERTPCKCIRCREIRDKKVVSKDLKVDTIEYETNIGKEIFISYVTEDDKIAGFLRLSLLNKAFSEGHFIDELKNIAIIREIHVYGQEVSIGDKSEGRSQHLGLGKKMIKYAESLSKESGFKGISVISAIGTREYYRKQGFIDGDLYLHKMF